MGKALKNTACPECSKTGQGKSLAIYDNGSAHCHECGFDDQKYTACMAQATSTKSFNPLIPIGEYKEITSRHISKAVCEKYKYSWTEYNKEIVQCASFMKNGQIIAQKIRTRDKSFRWLGDKSEIAALYGMEYFEPNSKLSVTICEGELDTLCWRTFNEDKWPILGLLDGAGGQGVKAIQRAKEYLNQFRKVVLMFDGDEAGRKCAEEAAKILPGKIHVVNMPDGEDVCSMIAANRGHELSKLEMRAVSYKPKDIVTLRDFTHEQLYTKEAIGIPLPFPRLSGLLRGLKKGRLYTFCAGSGLGKSTLVKEIAYDLMFNHNIKVGSIFLEQGTEEAMRDYIAMHLQIEAETFSEDYTNSNKEEREYAEDTIANNGVFYKHFGSLDTDKLLNKIDYMMQAADCDFIILDHISMVVSGSEGSGNERKDIDMLMTGLRSLIQSTGKSVIAVTHLKRTGQSRGSYNSGESVQLSDLRGSASLEQISDFVVALERNQFDEENGNITKVKVLKSRRGGKVGYGDALQYSELTGRLIVYNKSLDSRTGV